MKGLPTAPAGATVGDVGSLGWDLGAGHLPTPVAVLTWSAVEHNAAVMADYCAARDVSLAPHGKTTMAPQIVDVQLAHGAWGITVGSAAQARTFAEFGVNRLVLANQVDDPAGLREIARLINNHGALELLVIVDSARGVELMDDVLADLGVARPLGVLAELGIPGGRTGSRTIGGLVDIGRAAARSRSVRLRGVEGYEGVIGGDAEAGTLDAIDDFLDTMVAGLRRLEMEGLLGDEVDPILTAGGSAYFDRVVDRFAGVGPGVHSVLRSGCYIAHDHGKYHRLSPLDGRAVGGPRLQPALEVWASVVSTPETGRGILNAGRRDLSFDAGLPVVVKVQRRGSEVVPIRSGFEVLKLMDQHAILSADGSVVVEQGDMVALGVSHPCTTFDKWRIMPVVDDDGAVIDAVMTFF
jgi:D-serine deaminase-like pyridoxal phosphate-dependent protein